MIIAMIVNGFIYYYLNSYWSGRFIGYSMREQLRDILPSFMLASSVGFAVFFTGMEELFSLLRIKRYKASGLYEGDLLKWEGSVIEVVFDSGSEEASLSAKAGYY